MSTSGLNSFITGLTPPPVVTLEQYNGWQLRWKSLVFRPAELKTEGLLTVGILVYLIFWLWGSAANTSKAKRWIAKHLPLYQKQFSKPAHKNGLTEDGYTDFFNFSTGRKNIVSLHTVFTLRPRHDLVQYLFQVGKTLIDLNYRPVDDLQLDFKLSPGAVADNFVFAVVAKDELPTAKTDRWDLTFTKTSENPSLPPNLSVMSEFADITENILQKSLGTFNLAQVLQDPKIVPYFRSLSITDQPRERPLVPIAAEDREKHVILSLRAPDASHAEDTLPLVAAVFQLIDALHKVSLRPETKNKLKKTREELDKTIKEEAEKEKKEEANDAKAAAKRKAFEERISKLSAADQKKEMEKERKRLLRKSQGKVVRK
ncbi:hypothetical protein CPB83DRAFT_844026 [Crepidotus variabilis]|uniref:DUF1682-domain-containing protein n=1 Tax=Crepidotus variabilis TaxID=179855 RepID=A0A9P6EQP4_9AGAR|nr:hypothetical protein CPB83DRAFT_844026 [Crepidotus variabilis]